MFSSRITSKLQPSMWRASPWFEPSGVILGGLMITATGLLGYYVYRDLVVNPSSRLRPSERKDPDYIPSMDKADRFYSSPFRALENRPIAISPSLSSSFFRCFPKLFLFHSCNGLLSQMLAVSNPALLFTTPNVELMATHIKICATLRTPFASMPTSNSATMESALAPGLVLWAVAQATSFRTMG